MLCAIGAAAALCTETQHAASWPASQAAEEWVGGQVALNSWLSRHC